MLTFLKNLLYFHIVPLFDILMKLSFQGVISQGTKLNGTGDWKMNTPRHPVSKESNMLSPTESKMQVSKLDSFLLQD